MSEEIMYIKNTLKKYGVKLIEKNGGFEADLNDKKTVVILNIIKDIAELEHAITINEKLINGEVVENRFADEENIEKLVELNKNMKEEYETYKRELEQYRVEGNKCD